MFGMLPRNLRRVKSNLQKIQRWFSQIVKIKQLIEIETQQVKINDFVKSINERIEYCLSLIKKDMTEEELNNLINALQLFGSRFNKNKEFYRSLALIANDHTRNNEARPLIVKFLQGFSGAEHLAEKAFKQAQAINKTGNENKIVTLANYKEGLKKSGAEKNSVKVNIRIKVLDLEKFKRNVLQSSNSHLKYFSEALKNAILEILNSKMNYIQTSRINFEIILVEKEENGEKSLSVGSFSEKSTKEFYKIFLNYYSLKNDILYAASTKKIPQSDLYLALVHEITHGFEQAGKDMDTRSMQLKKYFSTKEINGAQLWGLTLLVDRLKEEGSAQIAENLKLNKKIFATRNSWARTNKGLDNLRTLVINDNLIEKVIGKEIIYGVGEFIALMIFAELPTVKLYYNNVNPRAQLNVEPKDVETFVKNTGMIELQKKDIIKNMREGWIYVTHNLSEEHIRQFFTKLNLWDVVQYREIISRVEKEINYNFGMPTFRGLVNEFKRS